MRGVFDIGRLTFVEARRRRILLAAVVCGLLFLAVYGVVVYFALRVPARPEAQTLMMRQMAVYMITAVGLYAVNLLVVALSVMLPVDTLSGEISSGVMQTLASKPLHRWEIVLGKWLVYLLMIAAYILLMAGGVVTLVWVLRGYAPSHLIETFGLMLLEAAVMLSICIAGGTRFSTVTNGIVAFAFYCLAFVGGWVEQVGTFVGNDAARYIGTSISLVSPADAVWRLALHVLQPPLMRAMELTPFSPASVPSPAMIVWAVGFIAVALIYAVRKFNTRAL
jgi:ABC-type transport system involved in multi-copper enzyme maturation permease subunit